MAISIAQPLRALRRAPSPTHLSAADEAWLRMDGPKNPMVICAVMITAQPLELGALRELIAERLLSLPRFGGQLWRRKPVGTSAFDLDRHVHAGSLGGDASEAALCARVSELMLQQLPRGQPLWEVHLIGDYRGGSALIWRIHHAVGDGTALLRVLLGAADVPVALPAGALPMHGLPRPRDALRLLASLARLVFLRRDARSSLKSRIVGLRRVAWSAPVSLEEVKAIGRAHGCRVNDVLTSALSGALHRHFVASGASPPRRVRAIVPVDLRAGKDERLGNRFGLLFLPLPLGTLTPGQRLATVKRWMTKLKRAHEASVAFSLLWLVGLVSPGLAALAIRFFARKASLVLTNVVGPGQRFSLGGARVSDVVFWVPQAKNIGLGLSIFSYAGEVRIGVNADAACLESPQELADAFVAELRALGAGVRHGDRLPGSPPGASGGG